MIATGKRQIAKARNVWSICRGLGTASIATCRRLKWVVKDAVTVIADEGSVLQFNLDPPAAVAIQVKLAVKRWRWRNLERTMPQLARGGSGNGALMNPVWKLLKSKQNDEKSRPCLQRSPEVSPSREAVPADLGFCGGMVSTQSMHLMFI